MIGKAFEVANFGLLVFVTFLLYRACPRRGTLGRYPWDVRIRLALPFTKRWQNQVAPEDIEIIRKYRRGIFTWELVFFASGLLGVAYFDLLSPRLFLLLATGQCRG